MTTRKAFTPAELRDLAKEPYDFHHPHLLDAMRGALIFCADVIDAANEALRVSGSDASPAPGRAPLTEAYLLGKQVWFDRKDVLVILAKVGIAPAGGIGGEP